jgi:hypothetical protein
MEATEQKTRAVFHYLLAEATGTLASSTESC